MADYGQAYEYDEDGNLISAVSESYGQINESYYYEYDVDGNLIREPSKKMNGVLVRSMNMILMATRSMNLNISYDWDGDGIVDEEFSNSSTYAYDSDGNLILNQVMMGMTFQMRNQPMSMTQMGI